MRVRWSVHARLVYLWTLLLVVQLCCQQSSAQLTDINYAFMSSGGGGFESSGSVPAIELAEEMIRANGTILAGYNLTRTAPLDSQCDRTTSLDQFLSSVPSSDPPVLALLGSGCSVATEPVAEIVHHWNISQISYSSTSIILNDRRRFRNYFRTGSSDDSIVPAIRSVIEFYGWRRVLFLTQEENLFTETFTALSMQLMALNITGRNRMIPSQTPFRQLPPNIFNSDEDFRVIFINTYSYLARVIICEAAKLDLTYPRYAWLTYGWYQGRWWSNDVNPNPAVDCTDQQLEAFLIQTLAIQVIPSAQDPNAATDTGLSEAQFYSLYEQRLLDSPFNYTFVSTLAYDAVWALAIALNKTANMINLPEDQVESITDCVIPQDSSAMGPSGLVPLENFTYGNSFMGCVIRWNLARTYFVGVTGPISFDNVGTRVPLLAFVRQYRTTDISGNVEQVKFGFVDAVNDNQFSYINSENNMTVYPDGIPPDGTPIEKIVTFHLVLVIIYDIIAVLGLIFATVCLVFNFAYRNRKIVRLTSPNLNYFIIAGCYIVYLSIFFRLIPTIDPAIITVQCHLQSWLSTTGYTLAFSTVLCKQIRVYYIFHKPTSKKKSLKDWHLAIIILCMSLVTFGIVVIGSAIPQLRAVPTLSRHDENPTGEDELGVRINFVTWDCFSDNNNAFIWLIVVFVYLALLQLAGFILAVQTRKVKIKALNDSKWVAAIIYVSSIVLIVLALVTFALADYLNITEVFFSGGLVLGSTAFLAFGFVPKMVSLYRDPHGQYVFGKKNPTRTIEIGKSGVMGLKTKSTDSEKIQVLENKIKELETELSVNGRRSTNETIVLSTNSNDEDSTAPATATVDINVHTQRPAEGPDADLQEPITPAPSLPLSEVTPQATEF